MAELEAAQAEAAAQRHNLSQQIDVTKARLQPSYLVQDAKNVANYQIQSLKQDGINHAKAHPVAVALGATALVAWMARKPLLKRAPAAVKRTYNWVAGFFPDTVDIPEDE